MDDDEETSELNSNVGFPFYYGLVIDKLIVGIQIAFWWIITIPLIIWAFVRTILIYLLLFGVLLVPILIGLALGTFLFLVTLYWVPAVSVALTTLAPLIAAGVEVGVLALNIGWFILIALVQLWNILIPLFVLVFIYTIHFILTVITLITKELTSTQLTSLFSQLIEVAFFFADLIVIVLHVIVSILPAALTLTISIAFPLLVLLFKTVVFLFPAVEFLLLTLFKLLPAVFMSVLKLVKIFANLLRSAPTNYDAPASGSPRYQQGIDEYFNTMVVHGRDSDWDGATSTISGIVDAHQLMPDYSYISDPFSSSANKRRRRDDGSELPTNRGSLHSRWRGNATDTMHAQRQRMWHDAEFYTRHEHSLIFTTSITNGLHAVMDTTPPLHTHMELMQRSFDKVAQTLFGYQTAEHALRDYNTRYGHPAMFIAHHAPDLHGSWLGKLVRSANPADEFNIGMSHHEWRRAGYPPVEGHPNAEHINRELVRHQQQILEYNRKLMQQSRSTVVQAPDLGLPNGTVPMPFEMPVILGSDCFKSNPKFILCLPNPKPRRFVAPEIVIPSNLPDPATCPGFVAPPSDPADWAQMFNPVTIIKNTWTYFRYILSISSSVVVAINKQYANYGWVTRFFGSLTISGSTGEPLTVEEVLCLIPYAWYPFIAFVAVTGAIVIGLPLIWLFFSLIVYILLPFRYTWVLVHRLLLYYRITAERVQVLDTQGTVDVARQKWWRERTVLRESSGRAESMPGSRPTDVVGSYEQMRSQPYTNMVDAQIDAMDVAQLHRLYTARKDAHEANEQRKVASSRLTSLIGALHGMGALSHHIRMRSESRRHMTIFTRNHNLLPHTSTLAYARDRLTNIEVALGHRPLDEAIPITDWSQ